jgi:hypothetical protein
MNPVIRSFSIWEKKLFFKQKPFSFATTLNQARSMLILPPHQAESFSSVLDHLSPLEAIFRNLKVFFLSPFGTQGFVSTLKTYEVLLLDKQNLGWWGLPKRSFIQKLRNYGFDVTLDLDLSKNFLNAYLGLLSEAKVRMGAKGSWGAPFYNLELIVSPHLLYLDQRYDCMIRTLRNLRTEKILEA